jgi:hypothetical protein
MAGPWSNRHVLETPEEIDRLQELLDRSAAGAGAHLRGIISDDHRLSAARVLRKAAGHAAARGRHGDGRRPPAGRAG